MHGYTHVPELSLLDYEDPVRRPVFCDALFSSLQCFGFVILREYPISPEFLKQAYNVSAAFFAQPQDYKDRYIDESSFCQRGYVPFGREHAKENKSPDLKEMWHMGRDAPEAFPGNIWPQEPKQFQRVFRKLYQSLDEIGQIILEALTEPLNVRRDYFRDLALGGNSLLRLLHYPPIKATDPKGAVRAAAHEDINLLTILVAASASGLELLDQQGQWLAIESSPNALIVDAGDMLARITNNVIPATTHRVVNPAGENTSRYSMPFFIHPKSEVWLSCIESCRDENAPPDIIADVFLQQRLTEIGLKVD